MELRKLIEKGEVIQEAIIDQCKLFAKEITVKGKKEIMERGPCSRIDGNLCAAYIKPAARWKLGPCPLATHIIHEEEAVKFKLNPIKASKQHNK